MQHSTSKWFWGHHSSHLRARLSADVVPNRCDDSVNEVLSTTTLDEEVYEKRVETWVEAEPQMLGEQLLVIGRQLVLDASKDVIDLLCIDTAGSLVVVELKRDLIGGSTDLQALRYAALLSDWSPEDIRKQAEGYGRADNWI